MVEAILKAKGFQNRDINLGQGLGEAGWLMIPKSQRWICAARNPATVKYCQIQSMFSVPEPFLILGGVYPYQKKKKNKTKLYIIY